MQWQQHNHRHHHHHYDQPGLTKSMQTGIRGIEEYFKGKGKVFGSGASLQAYGVQGA